MIRCQLNELHRSLKVVSVLLALPVETKLIDNDVEYYVGNVLIGAERGLTAAMLEVDWEDRYKSDKVYVSKDHLLEAELIQSTDAQLELMYQQLKMRSKPWNYK